MSERVVFLGGPFDRMRTDLTKTPPHVDVSGFRYERIDDPDTGLPLGGYVYAPEPSERGRA